MATPTAQECDLIADILDTAINDLPANARAVKAQLRTLRVEYSAAARHFREAGDYGELDPEIRPLGAVVVGESVMTGAGPARLRRVSDSGMEVFEAGSWGWINNVTRATPVVVVNGLRD